jgi:predicted DNA-binding transcriptional regulator AlpA
MGCHVDRACGASAKAAMQATAAEVKGLMSEDDNAPRLMNKTEAAAYCGMNPVTFGKWVARGHLPKALPMRRWDRKAIDAALDKMSGITSKPPVKAETALEKWRRENGR